MKRKETVREFIDKRSYGAYVTFEFDVHKINTGYFTYGHISEYSCISVEDFLVEYGRKNSYILDDYIVIDIRATKPSGSQGQTIWMKLQKKSEYVETLNSIELTPFEVEDIINRLEKVKKSISKLAPEYDDQAIEEIKYIITKLEEK